MSRDLHEIPVQTTFARWSCHTYANRVTFTTPVRYAHGPDSFRQKARAPRPGPGRRPRLPGRPGCEAHERRSLTRTSPRAARRRGSRTRSGSSAPGRCRTEQAAASSAGPGYRSADGEARRRVVTGPVDRLDREALRSGGRLHEGVEVPEPGRRNPRVG